MTEYRLIYDIILFDIDMPGTNGIDTARQVRKLDENVTILFITNMAQYAISAFEIEAADYILKPVEYYDFAMKFLSGRYNEAAGSLRWIPLMVSVG